MVELLLIFKFTGNTVKIPKIPIITGKIGETLIIVHHIHAVVVTFVAGSLEAGGLPGYPEVF
jgi:hypothetical protein